MTSPASKMFRGTPKGTRDIGIFGDAVDVNFVLANGTRAQRRLLLRTLKREAVKNKARGAV